MYRKIKFLARVNYRTYHIGSQQNYIKLTILRVQKKTMLVFLVKPSSDLRKYMRCCNYSWSRKYAYWYSYLNKEKVNQIKKIYQYLNS